MSGGFLKVQGNKVVDESGNEVILRGTCLGGWMNMENFITGFPGHEKGHRAAMLECLGQEKYDYFFDRWLEYFFTEADAKYFSNLGLNCIRLPINYRHFEDDANPKVLKEEGFKHLDRVINLCSNAGIYTIIDMHTTPGGQNVGWHSDNETNIAGFWEYKDFQDRGIWLWEQIATHYKSNPWVAGYNPLNEPADPKHTRLNAFYERVEIAIRKIDPHHILWLDGNTYSGDFSAFKSILPNCVYSIHDYSTMGFPTGEPYLGTIEQKETLRRQYHRKCEFQHKHGVPIWNGEFGPVYANPLSENNAEKINQQRYELLGEQLMIYDEEQIPWTIWLYKDIGLQGMVHTSPDSAWNRLIQPFLEKKKRLNLDWWGKYSSDEMDSLLGPIREMILKESPSTTSLYPPIWKLERHVDRAILHTFLSESLQDEFASLFKDKSYEELDELARSFHFDQCKQREGLNKIMSAHAEKRTV